MSKQTLNEAELLLLKHWDEALQTAAGKLPDTSTITPGGQNVHQPRSHSETAQAPIPPPKGFAHAQEGVAGLTRASPAHFSDPLAHG